MSSKPFTIRELRARRKSRQLAYKHRAERCFSKPYRSFYEPRNQDLPFFHFYQYPAYLRPLMAAGHPGPPDSPESGRLPGPRVRLAQPGINSVEFYEAVLRAKGCSRRLGVWICQVGTEQSLPGDPTLPVARYNPKNYDFGAIEDRDICITLLSHAEDDVITDFLERFFLGSYVVDPIITPVGYPYYIQPVGDGPDLEHACNNALRGAGLGEDETFSRSTLPATVKPIPYYRFYEIFEWLLPGPDPPLPDLQTRAAADPDGLERIYWVRPARQNLPLFPYAKEDTPAHSPFGRGDKRMENTPGETDGQTDGGSSGRSDAHSSISHPSTSAGITHPVHPANKSKT